MPLVEAVEVRLICVPLAAVAIKLLGAVGGATDVVAVAVFENEL
jgi:hypothetical protein